MKSFKYWLMISTAAVCFNENANAIFVGYDDDGDEKHRYISNSGYNQTPSEIYKELAQKQTNLLKTGKGYAADNVDLPASFSNSKYFQIVDQGNLGSCSANAGCGSMFLRQVKEYLAANPNVDENTALSNVPYLSRLALYYNERNLEGTTDQDSGATIADVINALTQKGVPHESDWTYDDDTTSDNPKFKQQPPASLDAEAAQNEDKDTNVPFMQIDVNASDLLKQIKTAVFKGYGVIIGIKLYESFESDEVAETGNVPMPSDAEQAQGSIGGHAMVIVGWDDATQSFIVANSWGTGWGQKGLCTFKYNYFTQGQTSMSANSPASSPSSLKKKSFLDSSDTDSDSDSDSNGDNGGSDTLPLQQYLMEAWVLGNVSMPRVK